MSYFGSLMRLCWMESLVAETLALKFKITEASWKRKQTKFSRDNSIRGLQCRRRMNINIEIILKRSRMQWLIRVFHVKSQASSVVYRQISPYFRSRWEHCAIGGATFHFPSVDPGVPFAWKVQGTVGGIGNICKMALEVSTIVYKARRIYQLRFLFVSDRKPPSKWFKH